MNCHRVLLPLVSLLFVTHVAAGHPFHVSIAEAEFNRSTKKLEVALRVHPSDLEAILSRRTKNRVDLDRTKDVDHLITQYVRETFVVRPKGGEPLKLKWVGKEVDARYAWLYFEFPCTAQPGVWEVTDTILCDWLKDQSNTILFRQGDQRFSLNFRQEQPTRTLQLPLSANPALPASPDRSRAKSPQHDDARKGAGGGTSTVDDH